MTIATRLQSRFGPDAAEVTVDTSDLVKLAAMLAAAGAAAPGKADAKLDQIVPQIYSQARGTVAGYQKASTGELFDNIFYDKRGHTRRIWSEVKQGAFLEYGTPTTGAPRPWLTGPAERGSIRMLRAMGEIGAIW